MVRILLSKKKSTHLLICISFRKPLSIENGEGVVLGTMDEGIFYLMHCTGHGQVDSYTAKRLYSDATIDM